MIKDMCRNFAETELKPTAGKNDQNHTFPGNEIKKLGELGMMGVSVATDYGGSGSALTCLLNMKRVICFFATWDPIQASFVLIP
jgi:alkylation response protein AidB-like acyl-CoA dehydrogenase